jgi:hypothetical protein
MPADTPAEKQFPRQIWGTFPVSRSSQEARVSLLIVVIVWLEGFVSGRSAIIGEGKYIGTNKSYD